MSGLDSILDKAEDIDLSGDDIHRITDGAAKVMSYHELADISDISQIFSPQGVCILLYETRLNYGHWVALIDQGDFIEFFDSYNFKPDEELNYAKYNQTPYLSNLKKKSGRRIVYNDVRLQVFAEDVNTCGRWTSIRVLMRDIPIRQFQQMFKKVKHYNGDLWVSALTYAFTFHKS